IDSFPLLNLRTPLEQEWNLSIGRSLSPSVHVQVAYVGKQMTHLESNQPFNIPFPGPGVIQNRRPYQRFGNGSNFTHSGTTNYHGLQATAERRFARGLSLLSAYTWSKAISTVCGAEGTACQDPYNERASRGVAAYDVPHRFVFSSVYELPSPALSS